MNYIEFVTRFTIDIPDLQRDYVQGADANAEKRDGFIDDILSTLRNPSRPLKLDFIYGSSSPSASPDQSPYFSPIDGQQRLTTLALAGWILARRGLAPLGIPPVVRLGMVYSVRTSTEQFVRHLFDDLELPAGFDWKKEKLSAYIRETPGWYIDHWNDDASVRAMLEMLDALNGRLNAIEESEIRALADTFFDAESNPIIFESLDMPSYKLTDDLYVKMNARGKHLTRFENWKAEFYGFVKALYGDALADRFSLAIEHEWCDLFWKYAIKGWNPDSPLYPRIDELFMRFFDFVTEMIYYGQTNVVEKAAKLDIDRAEVFSKNRKANETEVYSDRKNVIFLFDLLDRIVAIEEARGSFDGWLALLLTDRFDENSEKINVYETPDFFERLIRGKEVTLPMRMLLFAIMDRTVCYPGESLSATTDFIRIFWGWLLSRNQRLKGLLECRFDFNVEHIETARRVIDALSVQPDPIASLNASTIPQLKEERRKASYIASGKYAAVKILCNHPYLRGDLSTVYGALDVSADSRQVADRFVAFANLSSDAERVRALVRLGAHGTHPWRNYDFHGLHGHWAFVFSATEKSLLKAITALLTADAQAVRSYSRDSMEFYMLHYPEFMEASPKNYFYHTGPFTVWALQRISNRPLSGYNACPYAYTVIRRLPGKDVEMLGAGQFSWYSDHGAMHLSQLGLKLECVAEGWQVTVEDYDKLLKSGNRDRVVDFFDSRTSLAKEGESLADRVYLITDPEDKDRIESALAFLSDLASTLYP